ncbi:MULTISPECIES: PTS sugar transporter subunit IIA [Lactobacillus]|uniref:PTS Gat IIA n=1 Tax=Lactobacillus melliventris TaxID=1218507 RepID=A0A0F4LJS8_9LACO|nr:MULTISPECIES: PTS sugar transporter subunit IIA [Lactobacillus]KJY57831.1 PTS Gat IIA [Lactobacillus melliventris]MBC6349346.1 PTS sugar transporter subunit IIA [Lactobacillus melliventris]MBH9988792.1 PTS sugar transporter subunit IIA [Lactobacillus sp. M0392]MBI0023589.1 PTS sugar transporter subunit IIA [Lactobacillus sp. W8171]MBI0043994.1 PTS sugar transporter subunit IIA [Lactobacillus sp. M0393]
MENIILNEDLIYRNIDFKTSREIETFLADQLYENGYVKEGYKKALLEREQKFPTGLPSSQPAIAIPHANADLVNKTTLAIATLKEPVEFKNMGNTKEDIPVRIVIMLVIAEPHSQVKMLQKVADIVQNEKLRKEFLQAETKQKLLKLIQSAIGDKND